jgi:hypothetical protein
MTDDKACGPNELETLRQEIAALRATIEGRAMTGSKCQTCAGSGFVEVSRLPEIDPPGRRFFARCERCEGGHGQAPAKGEQAMVAERDALRAQVEAARKWTTESRPCACGHFVLRAMDKAKP